MATNLGDENSVYRILRQTVEELQKDDVTAELKIAERTIKAQTTRNFMSDKIYAKFSRQTGVPLQSYETYFDVDDGVDPTVYVNDVLQVVDTDYTFANSTVTFTGTTIKSGDIIVIQYKPDFFDDYANFLAASRLYATGLVDTTTSVGKSQYDAIKDQVKMYENLISSKPHVARARDHKQSYGFF